MDALPMPMGDVVMIAYLFYFEAVIYLYYYVYVVFFLFESGSRLKHGSLKVASALGSSCLSAVEAHAHQPPLHETKISKRVTIIHDLTYKASLQLH